MSEPRQYQLEATATVTITVNADAPDDVFTRMQDPDLFKLYYGEMSSDQVMIHFADNAVRNGVDDVRYLDGWGDLPFGAVRVDVTHVDVEEHWDSRNKEWVLAEQLS